MILTAAQIDAAGDRELDGLIAEHLFGWRWFATVWSTGERCALFHPVLGPSPEPASWRDVTAMETRPERFPDWHRAADVPPGSWVQFGVPFFSTDQRAATLVLDHLNAGGIVDRVGIWGQAGTRCIAKLKPWSVAYGRWTCAVEDTRAKAICRAALRQVCPGEKPAAWMS